MIVRENIKDFSLQQIFDCGQCFRWRLQEDGSYIGVAGHRAADRAARISFLQTDGEYTGTLIIDNGRPGINTEEDDREYNDFWEPYLDLKRDYGQIKRALAENDPVMDEVIAAAPGMRILNQDPWETLISFIISQNNNITRIKGCVENLCRLFGQPLGVFFGEERFAFPRPEVLASLNEEDLEPIRLGYRAPYIIDASRAVLAEGVEKLYSLKGDRGGEGYRYLCALPGVGPKVANCILLFGLQKTCCFPVDVWVKRVMKEFYGLPEKDLKAIEAFGNQRFGEYSGIAQQYLFYYISRVKGKK